MITCFSLSLILAVIAGPNDATRPQPGALLRTQDLRDSADRARVYLVQHQNSDGSFPADGLLTHPIPVTSLAFLALLETGSDAKSPAVRRALTYLRNVPADQPTSTHEIAMLVLALLATREESDLPRIVELAHRLQLRQAAGGGWTSLPGDSTEEISLTQLSVLALRDAAHAGVAVRIDVWKKAAFYWQQSQNPDGSWGLPIKDRTNADERMNLKSSTLCAMDSLSVCREMVGEQSRISATGDLDCCGAIAPDDSLHRGKMWLQHQIQAAEKESNPWSFMIYRLSGLERASRFSGFAFHDEQDWYAQGLSALLRRQNPAGHWDGNNKVQATSHALLFLARGLAPVLINKLQHADPGHTQPPDIPRDDWNRHPCDVGNLVDLISERKGWPRQMTSQEVNLDHAHRARCLTQLRQSPILFLTGSNPPQLSQNEVSLIKDYLQEGGFLFAAPTCNTDAFEKGFRELVTRIAPSGSPLVRLPGDHPVYWSELALDARDVELWGIDTGCRTAIIYCPEDLGCLWSAWTRFPVARQNASLAARIRRAAEIGINVCAYATGREPPGRFDVRQTAQEDPAIEPLSGRLLTIAQICHNGDQNSAPQALSNLLLAIKQTTGLTTSPQRRMLELDDPRIYRYPLLHMHGSSACSLSDTETRALQRHLQRGGVLFADACCGSKIFDESFRSLVLRLAEGKTLQRIPVDHDLFSDRIGHALQRVKLQSIHGDQESPETGQLK